MVNGVVSGLEVEVLEVIDAFLEGPELLEEAFGVSWVTELLVMLLFGRLDPRSLLLVTELLAVPFFGLLDPFGLSLVTSELVMLLLGPHLRRRHDDVYGRQSNY